MGMVQCSFRLICVGVWGALDEIAGLMSTQARCHRVTRAEPRGLSCLHSACSQVTSDKSPVTASNCHSSLHGMSCVGLAYLDYSGASP